MSNRDGAPPRFVTKEDCGTRSRCPQAGSSAGRTAVREASSTGGRLALVLAGRPLSGSRRDESWRAFRTDEGGTLLTGAKPAGIRSHDGTAGEPSLTGMSPQSRHTSTLSSEPGTRAFPGRASVVIWTSVPRRASRSSGPLRRRIVQASSPDRAGRAARRPDRRGVCSRPRTI